MKNILLIICLFSFATSANALVIGSFDQPRINYFGGEFETGNYTSIRSELAARGDTISTITNLTSTSLSGVDVFYTSLLNTSTGILSASEQTSLVDWVSGGGTLFAAGDISSWFPAYNSFLNPFGLGIGPSASVTNGTATVVDFANPITNGPNGLVNTFDYATAGLYAPGPYNTLATVGSDAILIQMDFGLGQIVAIGDHNLFTDTYIGTNESNLFFNVLDSASTSVPEPSTILLFSLGLLGLTVTKRKKLA